MILVHILLLFMELMRSNRIKPEVLWIGIIFPCVLESNSSCVFWKHSLLMDYWEATTKRNRINQKVTKTKKRLAASEKCRNNNRVTVSTGATESYRSDLTGPWGEYCNAKSKNNHILLPPSLLTKTCSRMSMNASLCKSGLCEHIFHSGAPQICISFVLLDAPHEWGHRYTLPPAKFSSSQLPCHWHPHESS